MAKVWGYEASSGNFKLFPDDVSWAAQMSKEAAQDYLRNHFREQLTREIPVAIEALRKSSLETQVWTGFWSLLRITLSPISFLGSLYKGTDHSSDAVEFIEEYIGRRAQKSAYLDLFGLVFVMFRHGLIHTAMPKVLERADGLIVGWNVTYDVSENLAIDRSPGAKGKNAVYVSVCPEAIYKDLLAAVDCYINDFNDPSKAPDLLRAFKEGFLRMAKVFRSTDLQGQKAKVETCLQRI